MSHKRQPCINSREQSDWRLESIETRALLPDLASLEGGLNAAEDSSALCFLLRPQGGAGSAARTSDKLLVLLSPAAGSDFPGKGVESLEDALSIAALLVTQKSES